MVAILQFDGGVKRGNPGAAYGSYAITGDFQANASRVQFGDGLTNNDAEYMALIASLKALKSICDNPKEVVVEMHSDSMLVVGQVGKNWKCFVPRLKAHRDEVHKLLRGYREWDIGWIPREKNVEKFGH